uniref:Uncharacterized protein n=1 Tax=Calcidiscus leptoporus TaxID=127549 RepID=A0A7S0J218_9EUKA|mmetsp:Transcript_34060/g.79770  ORF Transcript_34060/g.79770 Transcript_34060/m.79770 type:complete len:124 (+) Transcript_34060:170-541(+)
MEDMSCKRHALFLVARAPSMCALVSMLVAGRPESARLQERRPRAERATCARRAPADGLWFGEREGSKVVAGDLGFDPLNLMPPDPKAADLMRLKELKNGRLAMLAVMGIFMQYLQTGKAFPAV